MATDIQFVSVSSSNIAALAFTEEDSTLYVRFNGGQVYSYAGVPKANYEALLNAPSVGKLFNAHIKPYYDGEQVE